MCALMSVDWAQMGVNWAPWWEKGFPDWPCKSVGVLIEVSGHIKAIYIWPLFFSAFFVKIFVFFLDFF